MNIQIFMCCHNRFDIIPPLCVPVQCGSALNPALEGAVFDNFGDNISRKNREYCELTAHYYAYKNVKADYYGFCHYRRFFCFDESIKKPYIVRKKLSEKDAGLLGTERKITALVKEYEIIAPKSENMGLSAYEHYITSKRHNREDLDLFIAILKEKYSFLSEPVNRYLAGKKQYFCNMFIMKKELFFEYCEILFDALEEFDKQKKQGENFTADRTDGYLGELFTGIFLSYKAECGVRVKEISRIDTECGVFKRVMYYCLPPESGGRFWGKRVVKRVLLVKN